MIRLFATVLLMLFAPLTGHAASVPFEIRDAQLRPGLAQGLPAVGYLTLTNRSGREDVLVGVMVPGAKASLHETSENGGVTRMREIQSVPVPAGGSVTLKPGGLHIMITGLASTPEGSIPLQLRFKNAGVMVTSLRVTPNPEAKP